MICAPAAGQKNAAADENADRFFHAGSYTTVFSVRNCRAASLMWGVSP